MTKKTCVAIGIMAVLAGLVHGQSLDPNTPPGALLPDGVVLTNGLPDASQAPGRADHSAQVSAAQAALLAVAGTNAPDPAQFPPSAVAPPTAAVGQIRTVGSTAVADYGPHVVTFQSSLDVENAVDLQMIDGLHLRTRILGLIYICRTNGENQTVLLAPIKACQGEVLSGTQVIYRDCFDGVLADVLYEYSDRMFSQSIVLRRRPPAPDAFGFSAADTQLAVMTELFDPPAPRRAVSVIDLTAFNQAAGLPGAASLLDEAIQFPTMHVARGTAFDFATGPAGVPVSKSFQTISGRTFLVEAVPYNLVKAKLEGLTALMTPARRRTMEQAMAETVSGRLKKGSDKTLPAFQTARGNPAPATEAGRLARSSAAADPGVVLDYIIVSSAILDLNLSGINSAKTGFAAFGYASTDFWNGYGTFGLGNAGSWSVYWSGSGGELTNYSVATVANGNTRQTASTTDPMYSHFLYPISGGNITITLTNLLTSGAADNYYDVYVYGHGAYPDNTENMVVSASAYLYAASPTSYGTRGTTLWGNGWSNTTWEAGQQFVRFHNVDLQKNSTNAAAFSALKLIVSPNPRGYAEIAGVEVVPSGAVPAVTNSISSLIDLGFGTTAGNKTGLAAIGLATNDVWNEYHHPGVTSLVTVTNLLWSDSNASPVTMTVSNAPGEWGNGAGDGMYGPYVYQYGSITLTFTNLANGNYDFYAYGHSPANDPGSVFQLTSGTNAYPAKGTTIWDGSWNSTNWDESMQYVMYRGVPVMTNQLITLTVLPGDTGYAILNGLQINLPSPSSDTDSNADGIPDWWCLQYGLNPHTPGLAGSTAPDGLTYLMNYLQGRNPIAGGAPDTGNVLGLTVYTPLK